MMATSSDLAWLIAKRPRVGGVLLIALMLFAVYWIVVAFSSLDQLPEHIRDQGMFWTYVMSLVWVLVLFGALGVALFRDPT